MSHDRGCYKCFEDQRVCNRSDCSGKPTLEELAAKEGMRLVKIQKIKPGTGSKSPAPNDKQIGGTHYLSTFQHWDFVEDNKLQYQESCSSKYVARWRKKNGVQDLEKAVHYVEKLISVCEKRVTENRRGTATASSVAEFCQSNELTPSETAFMNALCMWQSRNDLTIALMILQEILDSAKAEGTLQ